MLDWRFTLVYALFGVGLVIAELIGVHRKQQGDTITENWRWVDRHMNGWARWLWRIWTGGFLVWLIIHFLVEK